MNKKAKATPFTQNPPALPEEKNYINKNELTIVEARKLLPENYKELIRDSVEKGENLMLTLDGVSW